MMRELEIRNWKLEIRNWKLEIGNWSFAQSSQSNKKNANRK